MTRYAMKCQRRSAVRQDKLTHTEQAAAFVRIEARLGVCSMRGFCAELAVSTVIPAQAGIQAPKRLCPVGIAIALLFLQGARVRAESPMTLRGTRQGMKILGPTLGPAWAGSGPGPTGQLSGQDNGEIARLNSAGLQLLNQGRIEEAVKIFHQALERDPENVNCLANLGVALMKQGDAEKAVEVFQRAAQKRPDDPRLSSDLAAALSAAGQPHEAVAQMRKSCLLAPHDAVMRRNLGVLLADKGQNQDAERELQIALRLDPADVEAHRTLARVFSRDNR